MLVFFKKFLHMRQFSCFKNTFFCFDFVSVVVRNSGKKLKKLQILHFYKQLLYRKSKHFCQ